MTNRIELFGRLLEPPDVRATPAGTPVIRFTVDCGAPGEELRLGIVITGEPALAAKPILAPGRQVRVVGRLIGLKRALSAGRGRSREAFEVVAASIERDDA